MAAGWRVAIDRGGTFADVVAHAPDGTRHVRKVLAVRPGEREDPVVRAIRELIPDGETLEALHLGTTIATNALLERRGARVGLAITAGFRDILAIGSQQRPELFDLHIRKPAPLVLADDVVEVNQRSFPFGTRPAQGLRGEAELAAAFRRMRAGGVETLAVVLAHHYGSEGGGAEDEVAALARAAGFEHVSCGHRVAGEVGLWPRVATTALDAYLTPPLHSYLISLQRELGQEVSLSVFRSSGGLAPADLVSGKDTVLSGPAGGAAACESLARSTGLRPMIGFDMGGTSTDVCRVAADGVVGRVFETTVDGVPLRTPMVEVITVAAGGGSIVGFDGRKLTVGPASAGAVPGPAAYGRDGPATLTDANLLLGRLQPDWFPAVFGEHGRRPLDAAASRARFEAIAHAMGSTPAQAAAGAYRIGISAMAEAIKQVTTARGIDPRTHVLCAFGGAAGQHACAVAEALGIDRVILHPLGSVLSAWGIAGATREETGVLAIGKELTPDALARALEGMRAMAARLGEGMAQPDVAFSVDLRTPGTESAINVALDPEFGEKAIGRAFAEAHRALYGFDPGAESVIELVNARVRVADVRSAPPELQREMWPAGIHGPPHPVAQVELGGAAAPVWRRSALHAGMRLPGPGLVVDELTTVVIDAGWGGSVSSEGTIHLSRLQGYGGREREAEAAAESATACDPVLLEIFQHRFMSIAEQMGHTLQRTAHSTNIKERLDFSCALFDGDGHLVANAPHIPVHLGAMGESVRAIVDARGDAMAPGDAFVTNDPFHGGSHLPDVTVVSPVFLDGRREFFVACRGHHADVGGVVPGSMPPDATSIDEEGVRIHDLLAVRGGELLEGAVAAAFGAGPHPARDLPERLSDLRAQLAANAVGVRLLHELCDESGAPVVAAYMAHAQDDAAAAMREALQALEAGERRFTDRLDDGTPIAVSISISGGTALVDFAGTGATHPGNLNAPKAVVMAAVLYAFRTLIDVDRPMPLNAGIFRPITVQVPAGSLLDPPDTAAVSGGNVETAQRLVDVLLGALGTCAASQGTMNNVTFGDDTHVHYETICGGAGAGRGFDGASAVHTHMTNTRITDPEVLERRHPVVLREFAIRAGSGGAGAHGGGDGVRRVLEALAPLTVSIVSERRVTRPYGAQGGEAGAAGRNAVERADGTVEELPGRVTFEVQPGDRIIIETPGGGGWGAKQPPPL